MKPAPGSLLTSSRSIMNNAHSIVPNGDSVERNGPSAMRSKHNLLLAGFLVVTLSGCGAATADKASLPERSTATANVGVRVIQPSTELDGSLVKATGRLEARRDTTLGAKASGDVAELMVDVGDRVKEGQALLRLDSAQARIQVEQARAAQAVAQAGFDAANLELERAKVLRQSGGVAQAGLDRADAAYKQAEAGLAQATAALKAAQRHLNDHTVRAPFSGVITARKVSLGEYVGASAPVFGLTDLERLEVILPVPETVIAGIQPGAVVRGVISPSGKPFDAKVRIVNSVVDRASRTVEVRADLEGERHPEMRPHAIVEVDFATGATMNGVFVPAQSVRREGDQRFVWVVQEGKVARRDVGAEMVSPGVMRITEGLDGTIEIVADAAAGLTDGMAVQVIR